MLEVDLPIGFGNCIKLQRAAFALLFQQSWLAGAQPVAYKVALYVVALRAVV